MAMRQRSITRGAAALAAAAALILSAGCGSGANEPKPLDPGKNDEPNAQDPTPDPTEPTAPTPTGDLETQLRQTTENFYATLSESYRTLDETKLEPLFGPECEACQSYVDFIASIKRKEQRYVKVPSYSIKKFEVADPMSDDDQQYRVSRFILTPSKAEVVDSSGEKVGETESRRISAEMSYAKEGDTWLVIRQSLEE